MEQIIVVLDDLITQTLKTKLLKKYNVNVIAKENSQEAINLLEIVPIRLIVCMDQNKKDPIAFNICTYLRKNALEIPIIHFGDRKTSLDNEIAVNGVPDTELLISKIAFLLGKESNDVELIAKEEIKTAAPPPPREEHAVSEERTTVFTLPAGGLKEAVSEQKPTTPKIIHTGFNLRYLAYLQPNQTLPFNFYSKIKKKGENDFLLKFEKGTVLSKEVLNNMLMRTGKKLYVRMDEFNVANEFLSKSLLERFKSEMSFTERIALNSDCYEILLDVFKHSKFNKYSVEIIKEIVKSINFLVQMPKGYEQFLNVLTLKKISYAYSHAHMTCLLIFKIVDKFPWSKEQSKNKIIYMSLFHDLSLHTEINIKLHHHYFQEVKNLNEDVKQLILKHADTAATILEGVVKAPKEMTNLIREHHGVKSGKGMIETLSISTSPLGMAFIVCEDLVTNYLDFVEKNSKLPTAEDLVPVFTNMNQKYVQLTYRDVSQEVQELLKSA